MFQELQIFFFIIIIIIIIITVENAGWVPLISSTYEGGVAGEVLFRLTWPPDQVSSPPQNTEGVSAFRLWQLAGSLKFTNVSTLKTDAASSPRNYSKFLPISTALHTETH